MENDQYYIRLSLKLGLLGALAFPFIYESYANIMNSLAVFLAVVGCIAVGVKFSRLGILNALAAMVFFVILSGGLGAFAELMVHSHVISFLEKRSKYFYMTYKDIIGFASWLFACYVMMFIVCICKIGLSAAIKSLKSNADSAASIIDNAFGDDDDE